MSGAIQSNFGVMVPHGRLGECIEFLEAGLRSLQETPYHAILGTSFLHRTDDATAYIIDFYQEASQKLSVAALYFEMNGFAINPDRWYFEGFAYRSGGSLWDLTWDTGWLPGWDESTSETFTLTGMEPVQQAFENLHCDDGQLLGTLLASEIAEHLVVARFDELIGAAVAAARRSIPKLNDVPVLSTAHEWDTLFPVE